MLHGLQALASYTWAHSLDYGSTDPAFPLTYGNSDLDVRNNLQAALSWMLPKPAGSGIRKAILENWRTDLRLMARSGFPVNLEGNLFLDPVSGDVFYSSVNHVPGRPSYLHGKSFPGGRAFNGGPSAAAPAFTLPDGTHEGNAPRNSLRGFPLVQVNLALDRTIHFNDRFNLQAGVDAFNVFNHPNFGYIDPYLTDLLFGQSTKMLNQSFGPTGTIYQQGGPRSIQLSLRLNF